MIDALLQRPRLIVLVLFMLSLTGIASYSSMARQEDPFFPSRNGLITVFFAGTTAENMERLILDPLQDELDQVEEVLEMTATARSGIALVNVTLQDDIYATDPAWDRVRQAIGRARNRFPEGVSRVELEDRLTVLPAVVLAVAGNPSAVALSRAAESIRRELRDLPGLSRIELEGQADEQITIAFRDADLAALGLSPAGVGALIAERNRVSPGGFVVVDGRRISLQANNEFQDTEALAATQIPLLDGSSVPLAAIADVRRTPLEPAQPQTWQDGERVVAINLYAQSDQIDAIRFGEQVRARVGMLRETYAPLEIRELFFQPDQVKSRLDDLQKSLLISMLIITAVVFYGMGWRMGLLVSAMLPLVTLIGLGIYNMGGGVLHQIAVIGTVISLGILIDNAIVMVENIQSRLNTGQSNDKAMRQAVKELAGPLGASTATTLAAFTPLLLAKGGTADFTRGIPVMIMLTLSVSYLLAISVAPLLAARFLRPARPRRTVWVEALGATLAASSERFPRLIIVAGLVLVAGSLALIPRLDFQFFPNADRPLVVIELFLPEGSDIQLTAMTAAEMERQVRAQPEVIAVHRFVGATGPGFYYNLPDSTQAPHRARLVAIMENLAATEPLIDWVRTLVSGSMPGLDVVAGTLAQGPPRAAPVEVRLYHADNALRLAAAENIFRLLKEIPGAVDVRHNMDPGTPVLRLNVDDASASRHGLSRADVAQTLFAQSFGIPVEQFRQDVDPIPIILRSREGTALDLSRLQSSYVFNSAGESVPLSQISQIEPAWQAAGIEHRNGVRVYSITAGLAPGYNFNQVLEVLNQKLADAPLPAGTRMELGGDLESSGEANSAIFSTAPVGILLLLFFLLLQFNSFKRVGIILLTVPLAAAGIFPGLILSGSPFGFQSMLGIIALVGIVVNNAIVLIDVIDQGLRSGQRINEAVSDAVRRRTMPILLTTATTVAGLLPLAFSSSTLWPPMAWAIISGLLASTVQTLLVVPAVCRLTLRPLTAVPQGASGSGQEIVKPPVDAIIPALNP